MEHQSQYTQEHTITQIVFVILVSVVSFLVILMNDFYVYYEDEPVIGSLCGMAVVDVVCLVIVLAVRSRTDKQKIETLDRIKAESRRNRYNMIVVCEALPNPAFLVNRRLMVVWANQVLLGFNSDILGKSVLDDFNISEQSDEYKSMMSVFDTGTVATFVSYYPPNTFYSSETYLEHHFVPLIDADTNISEIMVTSFNITGKMQLQESKQRLNSIVEASQDAIFVVDDHRTIHSWNRSAENMFGYSAAEIIGQPITILDHIIRFDVLLCISDAALLDAARIRQFERVELKRNGNTIYTSISVYPFVDDSGKVIGVSAIVRDNTEAVIAQQALVESEKQMRKLALHLDAALENERKEIAFAIHDELGYALSAIKMDISWMQKNIGNDIGSEAISERTNDMLNLVDVTIKKVKTLSANLRPSILDHFGLIAAIEEQAADFQRRTGIRCRVYVEPQDIDVEEGLRIPIFRIFQEAQTNITRYAKASRVDVYISYTDGIFKMKVQDNGVGIPTDKINASSSFGLLGIREKAASIGGKAIITGVPNEGTTIELILPLGVDKETNKLMAIHK
jgi:PAS domain S-box-containing protein